MPSEHLDNPVLLERSRGGDLEAQHRGAYCVLRGDDVLAREGQIDRCYFMRSAAKFFQALPAVIDGVPLRFGFGDEELALMCASHGGEPMHVEVARGMLEAGGLTEDDLACGPHPPMHGPSAAALKAAGVEPTRLHNNCSGKHAGMLLGALIHGEPTEGYVRADHPHQRRIAATLTAFAGIELADLRIHVDGCGAPTFSMSLRASARAFSRFGRPPAGFAPEMIAATRRLREAVRAQPLMIAGHDRFCSALISATRGKVIAKVGADGFYGAMCPEEGFGIALHIDDGSMPASERVLAAILKRLDLLTAAEAAELHRYIDPMRHNHAGAEVGEVRIKLRGF